MEKKRRPQNRFKQIAFVLGAALSITAPAFGQQNTPVTQQKWRPQDGVYAGVGKSFNSQCAELGDVIVAFGDHSIAGNEWNCKIDKIIDTAPAAVRLDMTCDDYNLAEFLKDPNPEERRFKESMTLRKIDEKSLLVRKTTNGKFNGPALKAAYCPADIQRIYLEGKARDKKEAAQKATEEPEIKQWRPLDGVYAHSGDNFNDRCFKSGDAVVELAKDSISKAGATCKIFNLAQKQPDAIEVGMTCNGTQAGQTVTIKHVNGQTIYETPGTETVILSKIDDKTFLFRKTENGKPVEPGERLSYCSDDAQRVQNSTQRWGR